MKNIHIVPTEDPSRIFANGNRLILGKEKFSIIENRQNIHITDSSEIVNNDWFYDTHLNTIHKAITVGKSFESNLNNSLIDGVKRFKRVILSTDQKLIDDGVQAIDDVFLEWLIENPEQGIPYKWLREEVEVVPLLSNNGRVFYGYKIIIPEQGFYCGDKVDYDEQCPVQCDHCVDALGVYYDITDNSEHDNKSDRMYSAEDMKTAFFSGGDMREIEEFIFWFKKFNNEKSKMY